VTDISHFDLGGDGEPLHFLHANGYPPECYQPLFGHLQNDFHIIGMKLRPLWDGANMDDVQVWNPYSDDLLRFLSDHQVGPVIGVGHSIGGIVTLRAAMREPKKFSALVLLDPVLFIPPVLVGWGIVRALGLGERLHPKIPGALKRRRSFDNLELLFRGYRARDVFRYMSDENLRIFIEGITRKKEDGSFELVYSPEWETHIYLTGMRDFDLWRGLPNLNIPTLIIRGAETDTFLPSAEKLVKKKNPKIQIHTLEKATHILPLEYPKEVAEIITNFLDDRR
jgi:pimeloyl-ACP methyl ester carboxylesterase